MWVKLPDGFPEDERVLGLTDKAFRLHVSALCSCARSLTDGEISRDRLRLLGGRKREVDELVSSGLWEGSGPWRIVEYLEHNWSREKVLEERRKAAERKAKSRAASQEESRRDVQQESRRESRFFVPSRPVSSTPAAPKDDRRDAHTRANGRAGGGDIDFSPIGDTVGAELDRLGAADAPPGGVS